MVRFGRKRDSNEVVKEIADYAAVLFAAGLVVDAIFYVKYHQFLLLVTNIISLVTFIYAGIWYYYLKRMSSNTVILIQVLTISFNLALSNIFEGLEAVNLEEAVGTILMNMCIFLVPILLSAITSMRKLPVLMVILALGSYVIAAFILGDYSMFRKLPSLILIFIGAPIILSSVIMVTRQVERENTIVMQERQELLRVLALEPRHLDLFKNDKLSSHEVTELISSMDMHMRQNIVDRVKDSMKAEETIRTTLLAEYPFLTASELNICCMVAEGRTVSQICDAKHVSPSTVTSVRSRLRRKMGLQHGESFRSHLLSIINRSVYQNLDI